MWDDALDRAIDEVAHDMTAGGQHGDLRTRVVVRLDAAEDTGRKISRVITNVALAAAAIVLVALVAYRQTRPAFQPDLRREAGADVRLRPDTTTRDPVAQAFRPASAPRASRRVEIPPSPIDALAPPPISATPMTFDDLDAPSIDLKPLDTIPPMALAPIDEGDRR